MRLDDYSEKDGKRVWLTAEEIDLLIQTVDPDREKEIAITLGGKAGLRRSEIVSVTPNDFAHAPDGFVRVWGDYAKRDKYREAPIPDGLDQLVRGYSATQDADKPVIQKSGTTVYRWVKDTAKELWAKTGDEGWQYLDVHDLRRSWGGHLLWNCGVSPMSVMQFGGWSDWATFEEHYMGEMTPEARDRERGKIDYMGGEPRENEIVYEPQSRAARETYGKN
jgi:integrase